MPQNLTSAPIPDPAAKFSVDQAAQSAGPQPISSGQRQEIALQIASALRHYYAENLLALGIYGSLARRDDGPFSDIEMHCVIQGEGIESSFEWSTGHWKAEVDVYSPDVILARAAEIEGDWSITHTQFTGVWVLYDPTKLFPHLQTLAIFHPPEVFDRVITEVIIGEIYELIGKVRNAQVRQDFTSLSLYTLLLAQHAACLVGLANRHLYTSSSTLFTESLKLPDRPEGYSALCQVVMRGELSDPARVIARIEDFWRGLITWAGQHRLPLETSLEALLRHD